MLRRIAIALLLLPIAAWGQVGITITNTTVSTVPRLGINLQEVTNYGPGEKLRYLNVVNGGYVPSEYYNMNLHCLSGGTQTTTNWHTNTSTYANNFFGSGNFTYTAISQTGTILGTGAITASTATDITLGTPMSAPCTPGSNTTLQDMLIIHGTPPSGTAVPSDVYPHTTGTITYSSNVSPSSANQTQSLQIASGSITYYLDSTVAQNQNTVSTTPVVYMNFNGSYNVTYQALCISTPCAVTYTVARGSGSAFSPACTGTDTALTSGWTVFSHTCTGVENGSQTTAMSYVLSTGTGTVDFADMDVIEGSTYAGNNTVFRDSYYRYLKQLNPGVIRYMDTNVWCSDLPHMMGVWGTEGICGLNPLNRVALGIPIPYTYVLQLANSLGISAQITTGQFTQTADWTTWMQFLGDSGCSSTGGALRCAAGQNTAWNTLFSGEYIYTSDGNEPWNSGPPSNIDAGNGIGYGAWVKPHLLAAKAATGYYNSTVDKLIEAGDTPGSQSYGIFGWTQNVLNTMGAGCSHLGNTPDFMEFAPYTLNNLSSLTDPYTDEVAETWILANVAGNPTSGGNVSLIQTDAYLNASWCTRASVYEYQYSTTAGSATPTQAQMNGISQGWGNGQLIHDEGEMLQDAAGLIGPISIFGCCDQPYNSSINSTQQGSWSSIQYLAAGPGQISGGWTDVYHPDGIMGIIANKGTGLKTIKQVTLTGVPTLNYAGGQAGTIPANSAVALVHSEAYVWGGTNVRVTVANKQIGSSQAITLSYASGMVPVGTITRTVMGASNAVTDNNANMTINNNGSTPPVVVPSSGTLSGNTDTICAACTVVYTYSTVSTSTSQISGITISGATVQ